MTGAARVTLPRVGPLQVAARAARWSRAAVRALGMLATARMRGPVTDAAVGQALRQLFEHVGGTAIKVGQQLAVRTDLLPAPVCAALLGLSDGVAPIPAHEARARLEAELGAPVESVLTQLDPDPIGSASVACVYRGQRLDGRQVALKLRRLGVRRAFASDLAVLGLVVRVAEATALVRSGLFTPLLDDLRQVLSEEASFRTEARYQRAFRRTLRRDSVRGVRAPEVHSDLCTDALLVTELIEAVPLSTLLVAVESGDRATLARLEAQGITPGRVARRLAEFSLWVRFEAPFFHADPHAGNLFVDPDSALVLVDFGACGRTSNRTRRHHLEVLRHLVDPDPSASARIMLSDLSPLPRLDRDGFEGEMEQRFQGLALAMRDKDAHWSERIVVSVWLAMLEVARRYELRVNLDTVRSIRAVLLYDTLSFRLDGRMGLGVLRRYLHQLDSRRARARPRQTALPRLDLQASLDHRVRQLEATSVARHQAQRFTRASVHLARAMLGAVQLVAAGVVVFGALTWLGATPVGPLTVVVAAASVAIALTTLSRTLTLLDRAEP